MQKRYGVFLSSTFHDLKEERQAVIDALGKVRAIVEAMEFFGPDPKLWPRIKQYIDQSDYYLLILAGRYGSQRDGDDVSYTERELQYALEIGMPIIAFVHDDPSSLPASKNESEQAMRDKFQAFRQYITSGLGIMCEGWRDLNDLVKKVAFAYPRIVDLYPTRGWARVEEPRSLYVRRFVQRHDQPFIMDGGKQTIDTERAYRLLRYMFEGERFQKFRALDLAALRWQELVNQDEAQTINMSQRIFYAISELLENRKCTDFKRLIALTNKDIAHPLTTRVLKYFHDHEERWRTHFGAACVETRIVHYDNLPNNVKLMIHKMCDFALFIEREDDQHTEGVAIIESGLESPLDYTDATKSSCTVCSQNDVLKRLDKHFSKLWIDHGKPLRDEIDFLALTDPS